MSNLGIASIVAVATCLFGFYKQIIEAFKSATVFLFGKIEIDKNLASAVYKYCRTNMSAVSLRGKTYVGCQCVLLDDMKSHLLAVDMFAHEKIIFRKGLRFLVISPGNWYYNQSTNTWSEGMRVWLPRFFWNQDEFINNCVRDYTVQNGTRFNVTKLYGKAGESALTMLGDKAPTRGKPDTIGEIIDEVQAGRATILGTGLNNIAYKRSIDPFYFFPFNDQIMSYVADAEFWLSSQLWHQSKSIPWKLGWIVHGKPGSGKTLLLASVAQKLDLPILYFDLRSMTNEEFSTFWAEALTKAPCMILFEDFDNIFHKRENIIKDSKLTFDCLLNCISGVQNQDGVFLAITTNDVSQIDCALGCLEEHDGGEEKMPSRPGRIDRIIEINDMDRSCREKLATRLLEGVDIDIKVVCDAGEGMTAAQFSEYCKRICVKRYQESHNRKIMD